MAQQLTQAALLASQALNKSPNIILQIDGIDDIFGASFISKLARYGEDAIEYGQAGLVYGGTTTDERSRDIIDLTGSTSRIEQQLEQDKGSISSITTITIKLLDGFSDITELLKPGTNITDILGARAAVYYQFQGTSFPEDAIVLLDGIVTETPFVAGAVKLRISHPSQFMRQQLFNVPNLELTSGVNSSTTTIPVGDTSSTIPTGTGFRTFYKIGDEIIEFNKNSNTSTSLQSVTRGSLNTVAQSHSSGDKLEAQFVLEGNCIDIALRLMLSGRENQAFTPALEATSFDEAGVDGVINNAIFFERKTLDFTYGVSTGDTVVIASKPGSPITPFISQESVEVIQENPSGTYIITSLSTSFLSGDPEDYTFTFLSNFAAYPIGLQMIPKQVDVGEMLRVRNFFAADFPDMRLHIKSAINAMDFINKEIFFPNGLYSIPRSGRVSVGRTTPPLIDFEAVNLDKDALVSPSDIVINRSINRNFYNGVTYQYDIDSIEETFLQNLAVFSATSASRINFPNKILSIEAGGFREDISGTATLIRRQADQFLDRFRFAAEEITNVKVPLGVGFNVDVGDTVIFGDPDLNLADTKAGDRAFTPRVMEVTNKSFPISGDAITLRLLDTSYSAQGRFGVISPSSKIISYSDGSLKLELSYGQNPFLGEAEKWSQQVGEKLLIHSADYSAQEIVEITGFDPSDANTVIITEPSITVQKGFFLNLAEYDEDRTLNKSVHVYFNPEAFVASGSTQRVFTVTDASELFKRSVISVNSPDFSDDSLPVEIIEIDGNEITVSEDLGFVPSNGDEIRLIGFIEDEGLPYQII